MLLISDYLRARSGARTCYLVVTVGLLLKVLDELIFLMVKKNIVTPKLNNYNLYLIIAILILLYTLACGLLSLLRQQSAYSLVRYGRYLESDVVNIREERIQLETKLRESDSPREEWFDSLELNLNHISEYYAINKSQSRNSFRMGVIAVLLGWVALLTGIALLYHNPRSISAGTVTTVSGVLIQFIGASCFHLYNKARTQIEFFYQKLNSLQGNMLAVRLCEQIEDPVVRDEVRRDIINSLLSKTSKRSNNPAKKMKVGGPKALSNGTDPALEISSK